MIRMHIMGKSLVAYMKGNHFLHTCLPGFMKTGLGYILLFSLNFSCLSLFTVLFSYVFFSFDCFVMRDLCRSGCRRNFANSL